jgi:hypothetical protein
MTVAYSYNIHNRQVLYVAGHFCVSLWTHKTERTTAVFEDRVKENTEPAWKLDIVACVSKPGCSQRCRISPAGQEFWFDYRDSWRGRVWPFKPSCELTPGIDVSIGMNGIDNVPGQVWYPPSLWPSTSVICDVLEFVL